MDENAFDIDQTAVAVASDRFPAHRLPHTPAEKPADLGYLAAPTEFGEHAWDENGHL
ncbi:MAG: hypothetical protein QM621_05160 [Aeromicrobium sp.]|uniref:hypothetical protein n=1 Tax=Aeromicrobium sp. TaxID=1871063 RepID=UPI0039E2CF96